MTDRRPRTREGAVEAALLYTFQLSNKDYRKMQTAMSETAFIRALEQDGFTVAALAAPSEGLDERLYEAVRAVITEGIDSPGVRDELHLAFYAVRDARLSESAPEGGEG